MKHQVAGLEGEVLDFAVAHALGMQYANSRHLPKWFPKLADDEARFSGCAFRPSTSWEHGGPIIERERINVHWWAGSIAGDRWARNSPAAGWWANIQTGNTSTRVNSGYAMCATPLIAAMRAYISSKFGDEVDLP